MLFFCIRHNVTCMISAEIESQQTFSLARGKAFCLPLSYFNQKSNKNDLTDLIKIHKTLD